MHILGIYLDPPFIRCAAIRRGRQGIEIAALQALDPNVKPLYIKNFTGRIASGLSAKDFLIRSLELKVDSNRHIEEAIAFQSEATSHFKAEEILSVPLVKKKEKGFTEALLFTVSRESLLKHLSQLEALEIDPDAVSVIPLALCHFIRWKFPNVEDAFIVDLGSSETTCVFLEKGELKKAHAIPIGVEGLLSGLLEDRKKILLKKEIEGAAKQIDLLLLKPTLNPHLTSVLSELRQEIAKVLFSFSREKKGVIFTGRTDPFIHFREYLIDGAEVHPLTLEEQKFAVSIGLAIEQTVSQPLQLRREEFFPKNNWKKMGAYAVGLCAGALLLSVGLTSLGMRLSYLRKAEMVQALSLGKSSGNLEEKIDQWIAAIETNNKEYSYIVQAPKVTEVLAWISSHPLLEALKNEGDPIEIRDIRYQLITMPKIGSTKDPYLAKVELEFQFSSAMNARRFHEVLRQGDERVNPDLEITWDVLSDGYRTSFYLKNRIPHVL